MTLSPDTLHVLDHLEASGESGLRKRDDLGVLLELSAERGDWELVNELFFEGALLANVYGTLRRSGSNAEGYDKLEREFADSAERLRANLARALVDADDEQVERFETTYYAMTQGALRNLVDLAHDLKRGKQAQRSAQDTPPPDPDPDQ